MTGMELLNKQTQELCDHITIIAKRIEDYVGAEAQFSSEDVQVDSESVMSAHKKLSGVLGALSGIEEKYLREPS